jgi:hypothetical protein
MSYSSLISVAERGRRSWADLHERAYAVHTPRDLLLFASYAESAVLNYGCLKCRHNARARCGAFIPVDKNASHPHVTAVAWAARLHACVTRGLIDSGDGYVSTPSRTLMMLVESSPENDFYVARVVGEPVHLAGVAATRGDLAMPKCNVGGCSIGTFAPRSI